MGRWGWTGGVLWGEVGGRGEEDLCPVGTYFAEAFVVFWLYFACVVSVRSQAFQSLLLV